MAEVGSGSGRFVETEYENIFIERQLDIVGGRLLAASPFDLVHLP